MLARERERERERGLGIKRQFLDKLIKKFFPLRFAETEISKEIKKWCLNQ